MSIRTILLPIRDSDTSERLLETGLCAALQFGAHIDALFVHPNPEELLPYATLGLSRSMKESVVESARRGSTEQAARLRALFEDLCGRRSVPVRPRGETPGHASAGWVEETGMRNSLIARHGRLADLVIVPRPARVSPPPSSLEAALRESGRPVLLVPRGEVRESLGRRVGVGWNGSKEAAQAIAAAQPCMHSAESALVFTTAKRMQRRPNADDVVTYLRCHEVRAATHVLDISARTVGEALLAASGDAGVDLLVVGGYSRSRLRDMVMGGVTRHLLAHAAVPVLLVH